MQLTLFVCVCKNANFSYHTEFPQDIWYEKNSPVEDRSLLTQHSQCTSERTEQRTLTRQNYHVINIKLVIFIRA